MGQPDPVPTKARCVRQRAEFSENWPCRCVARRDRSGYVPPSDRMGKKGVRSLRRAETLPSSTRRDHMAGVSDGGGQVVCVAAALNRRVDHFSQTSPPAPIARTSRCLLRAAKALNRPSTASRKAWPEREALTALRRGQHGSQHKGFLPGGRQCRRLRYRIMAQPRMPRS